MEKEANGGRYTLTAGDIASAIAMWAKLNGYTAVSCGTATQDDGTVNVDASCRATQERCPSTEKEAKDCRHFRCGWCDCTNPEITKITKSYGGKTAVAIVCDTLDPA